MISIADIDLLSVDLKLILTSVQTALGALPVARQRWRRISTAFWLRQRLTRFPSGSDRPRGHARAGGRRAERDGLEAWVATIEESTLHASGSALAKLAVAHNEVVDAALATGRTPVPARFGSRFDDDDALSRRLFRNVERD